MISNKITIGAAIIAKNEEGNIVRCLRSIGNVCEQIVVIDTGSNDTTPVLAAKYGANVFFHKWQNNFAEARNFAIRHLWTDWILYIDADEELIVDKAWANIVSAITKNKNAGGVEIVIRNWLSDSEEQYKMHNFTRLFKNDKKIYFVGKVHEQVAETIALANYETIKSDIIIEHYGYMQKNTEKELRNKQLLEEEMKSNNGDDYVKFHLANTEFSMGNNSTALELFQQIVASNQLSQVQKEEAHIKIGQIYLAQNQFENAINSLNFTASNNDSEGLRLSIIGAAYLHQQEFTKAKEIYSRNEVITSKLVNVDVIDKAKQVFQLLNI